MYIAAPTALNFGFFNHYIQKAAGTNLVTALHDSWAEAKSLLGNLTEDEELLRYETGKWNIREITAHLIDAERNFCYRAMRLSRHEQSPLPSYDAHQFVMHSFATDRDMKTMLRELELLREATIIMYESMPAEMLDLTGPARDVTISVRALGFVTAGHMRHHVEIIRERYLAGS